MQTVELLKRILKHYSVDLALAIVFMLVAFVYVYDQPTLLSAIARKVALASAGLVYYYITRVAKSRASLNGETLMTRFTLLPFAYLYRACLCFGLIQDA
jgi:putative exporter of polyketide antibiotics